MKILPSCSTLLTREHATIRRVVASLRAEHRKAHPALSPKPLAPERQQRERRARRYARYEQVVQLQAQGWSQRAIAQETGLRPQTVAIYLRTSQFPERAPHPPRGRVIEPYLDYLRQRWEQGEHNGRLLFEEIRAQGYRAGLTEVYVAIQLWAEASQIPELIRFVHRLRLDWEAMENALLFASSQGQVEGQVNRLKVFERQGYGRTSPALLQVRLVEAGNLYRICA